MPDPTRMPVLFVGHGSPMNAIEDNVWSRGFARLGAALPRPRAILAISAHWFGPGGAVTAEPWPRTIHDFGGFPDELFAMRYPAPGSPELAARVRDLLGADRIALATDWGLDHGTWSVLCASHPAADVPVVQVRLDARLTPAQHLARGAALAPLRDDGVLVLASGNVTHNLGDAFGRWQRGETSTPPWARDFDAAVAAALAAGDHAALLGLGDSAAGRMAHPSPDHWLPLLYAAGAAAGDPAAFPVEGFDLGSLSMRSVEFANRLPAVP